MPTYKYLTHTAEEVDASIDTVNAHVANSTIHVTAAEKTNWDGKANAADVYPRSQIDNLLARKVDKVEGKQLSTEDFTTADKEKLASLENFDDSAILSDISALQVGKVDKVAGKQLSTEDFTAADKAKLASLENYDDSWIQQAIGAETAARESADAALQTAINGKQDALTIDSIPTSGSDNVVRSGGIVNWVYGTTPNTINSGDDLNDYFNPGTYRAATASIAASLYNCPTTSGFRLEVVSTISAASSGYQIQRLYPNNSDGEFFMRRRLGASSGNWGDWYRFAGTVVQPINVPSGTQSINESDS